MQVLDGLDYLHNAPVCVELAQAKTKLANGIVHRDLSPRNILLTNDGSKVTAKISHSELARDREKQLPLRTEEAEHIEGTLAFMSRYQLVKHDNHEPAMDVWAAAACYYNMLTGCTVRDFRLRQVLIEAVMKNDPVPILKRNGNVNIPPRLAEVIDHALIEKPNVGVQSAAELNKDE